MDRVETMSNKSSRVYQPAEVCTLLGVTRKTLFYYDKSGLLKPSDRVGPQNTKVYDTEALERLSRILELRDAGLHVAEIKEILDDQTADPVEILTQVRQRTLNEQTDLHGKIEKLNRLIQSYEQRKGEQI